MASQRTLVAELTLLPNCKACAQSCRAVIKNVDDPPASRLVSQTHARKRVHQRQFSPFGRNTFTAAEAATSAHLPPTFSSCSGAAPAMSVTAIAAARPPVDLVDWVRSKITIGLLHPRVQWPSPMFGIVFRAPSCPRPMPLLRRGMWPGAQTGGGER